MFNVSKVLSLTDQVGWKQPIDPKYAIVDAANQASLSGRNFNDNSYVKIPYIQQNQDYTGISDAEFNDVLKNINENAVVSVLDRVFNESDFIDRQVFYKYANNKINTDVLPDGFVGYELTPSIDKNYSFEITRDLLEFQGAGDVTLVLYNSNVREPIFSETVSVTSEIQEAQLNWRVDNTGTYYKGTFYYGYLTSGVSLLPFRRDYQGSNSISNITGLNIQDIQVKYTPTGTEIFDLSTIEGASESWGLNPDVLVFEDFTDFILQNRGLFSYAIQLQGQIKAMMIYLSSLRSNRHERISDDMISKIAIELDGANVEAWDKKGLTGILSTEITRLKEEVIRLRTGYMDKGLISVTRS